MKQALCFRPLPEVGPYLENWDVFLMDRAVVDDPQKLDPSIKQIIPYVTFYRTYSTAVDGQPESETIEVLSYSRGKETTEGRLVDKRSVGVGGHIDRMPELNESILQLIFLETKREIEEELGIDVNAKALHAAIISSARNFNYLVMDDGTVNSVHLGFALMLNFNDHATEENFKLEAGHIEDPKWIGIEQISDEELNCYEGWSQEVIKGLRRKLGEFHKAVEQEQQLMQHMREMQSSGHLPAMPEDGQATLDVPAETMNQISELNDVAKNTDDVTSSSAQQ